MRLVAILNQKGGVGKTTTAVNLGAALALRGRRVLLVDLDPQGNCTDHLGVEPAEDALTVYDVLTEGASLADAAVATGTGGLHVVPSHEDLAGVEVELAAQPGRETRLKAAVEKLGPRAYDWLIVDCPPSLGILSLNAMAAVREVYVALQTEYFALRGMTQLQRILDLVRKRINPDVRLAGILATLVDPVTNLSREVIDEVASHFGDVVFKTRIRKSVRLAEAPGHRQHVLAYAPESTGALDYQALAKEVEERVPAAAAEKPPKPEPAKPAAPAKPSQAEAPKPAKPQPAVPPSGPPSPAPKPAAPGKPPVPGKPLAPPNAPAPAKPMVPVKPASPPPGGPPPAKPATAPPKPAVLPAPKPAVPAPARPPNPASPKLGTPARPPPRAAAPVTVPPVVPPVVRPTIGPPRHGANGRFVASPPRS